MLGMPISFPACQKITLFSTAHLLRRVLSIKWKPSLPFNVHSLDSDVDIHQKDTLDLALHPSCLKALNDGGCLRLSLLAMGWKGAPCQSLAGGEGAAKAWYLSLVLLWESQCTGHVYL